MCFRLVLTIFIGFFQTTFHHGADDHVTLRLNDFIDRYVTEISLTYKLDYMCNTCIQTSSGGTLQLTRVLCILFRNEDLVNDEGRVAPVCAHDKMVSGIW